MNPSDLRRILLLEPLAKEHARMLTSALGGVSALIGADKIEGHASWFDDFETPEDAPDAVHIRVLTAGGVITLDYDFSFDGLPDARLLSWSRVRALRVIAKPGPQVSPTNAWLETDGDNIEFAGAANAELISDLIAASRKYLS